MATVKDKSGNTQIDKHIPDARDASSASGAFDIVPSDTTDLPSVTRAIMATDAGTVDIVMDDGSSATFTLTEGQRLPIRARRVNATGTSATGLIGMI